MKNSFFLVIPEQKNDPGLLLSFEERSLNQWLAELPSANLSLSTRLFHDLIIEMNGLAMPAQNRLEALELLRHDFLVIEDHLRSRLIHSGFPKTPNELKIMDLLVSLEKQFTIGYWITVRELTHRSIGWLKGKNSTLTIQRTIRGLSGIVVSHSMMGTAVPDWIWIDLHSLYKLSVKLKKETSKVTDESSSSGKSSAEDCYKQILLLSLADPSGLMQKEFLLSYAFIEKITNLVRIETAAVAEQKIQCIILMDEDSAPYFDSDKKTTDASLMYLNLGRLHKISKQSAKFSSKNEPRFSSIDLDSRKSDKISSELFEYLIQRWMGHPLLGSAMFGDRLDRYIAIGLETTHSLQNDSALESEIATEIRAETESNRALSCQFDNSGALSIGSFVSCRKTDANRQPRFLGIVCKMTLPNQSNKIIFELKAIAAQSFSVTYQEMEAKPDTEPQKAILYAIKDDEGEKSFIIMNSFMSKDGDLVRMSFNNEEFPIILKDRTNIGLGYWQFECRRVEEKAASTHKKHKKGYDFL